MSLSRSVTIFIVFLCAYLTQHVSGLPQAGHNWSKSRHNATVYSNRWQQKFQTAVVANNTLPPQQQWQRGNGTRPSVGGIYQPQGERLWLKNNQSHPYIQVPGVGQRANLPAAANQQNPGNSFGSGNSVGWRTPQSYVNYTQPNHWGPVRNSSARDFPNTRQPIRNNGWSGSSSATGNSNNTRPIYNPTFGGQNTGTNWYSPGNKTSPLIPANNANWNGVPSNNIGGSSANSYPVWDSRLPGSTLVTGNNNQNSYFGNGPSALAPINPASGQFPRGSVGSSSSGIPLAPLTGDSSWSSNPSQFGLSYVNGQPQPQTRPSGNSNPYANLFI